MDKQIEIDFDKAECIVFGRVFGFDVAQSSIMVADHPLHADNVGGLGDTNLSARIKTNIPQGVTASILMGKLMYELKHDKCFVVCNGKEYPAKNVYVEYEEGSLTINFYGNRDRPVDAQAQQVEK